jgi:CRP-like cAMP-binding protein
MSDNFKNIFKNYSNLTESDLAFCKSYFELLSLSKNSIAEEENKIPRHLYFINEGYARLFYLDKSGNEVTTLIGSPNKFITSFLDFINQKKSTQNLACITDCEFYRIERSKLVELIEKNENFRNFSLIIFEQAITTTNIRANDLATLSAELRYKKLLEEQPEIIQNVPVQHIASYLGIKPQSLSRIRKQIIK